MKRARETQRRMTLQSIQSPSASTAGPKRSSIESQTLLVEMEAFKKQKTEGVDIRKIHARHLQKISGSDVLLDNVEDMYLYKLNFV